jgi:hypothetical protein
MWAALNELATRKRSRIGQRVKAHGLLIEDRRHSLAANDIKLSS